MLILLCCDAVPVVALSCLFCCGVVFVIMLGLRCHSALLLKCFCACIAGLLCSCRLALIVGAMLRLCNCKFNLQCLFCCAGVLIEMFCLPCAVVLTTLIPVWSCCCACCWATGPALPCCCLLCHCSYDAIFERCHCRVC